VETAKIAVDSCYVPRQFLTPLPSIDFREIRGLVHAYNACAVLCLLYVNPLEKSPPPLHATDNSTLTFTLYFLRIFFKDTLYFLLKYVLPPVLFTLTQFVLLLITSTFTRVQIQSNLGTTGCV
jgi:hypothetical protein